MQQTMAKTSMTGRMFDANRFSAKSYMSPVGLYCLQFGSEVTSTNNIHRVFSVLNQHKNSSSQPRRKTRKHSLLQSEKLVYAKYNKIADSQKCQKLTCSRKKKHAPAKI